MFLLQLLQQRIKFSPYGLFDIDLELFCMVISGTESLLFVPLFQYFTDTGSMCDIHSDINSV